VAGPFAPRLLDLLRRAGGQRVIGGVEEPAGLLAVTQ
jgi:hypothetical protein